MGDPASKTERDTEGDIGGPFEATMSLSMEARIYDGDNLDRA